MFWLRRKLHKLAVCHSLLFFRKMFPEGRRHYRHGNRDMYIIFSYNPIYCKVQSMCICPHHLLNIINKYEIIEQKQKLNVTKSLYHWNAAQHCTILYFIVFLYDVVLCYIISIIYHIKFTHGNNSLMMLNIYWCLLSFPCKWNHARKDIWRTCLCLSTSFFRFITGFHSWLFEVSIDLEVIWKNHVSVIHTQSENIMHLCVILTALPNFNIEILWDVFNPF